MQDIRGDQNSLRLVRSLIIVGFTVVALLLTLRLFDMMTQSHRILPIVVNFARFAASRSEHCSIADAWRSVRAAEQDRIGENDINQQLKIIDAEGSLVRVATSSGKFWMPRRDVNRTSFVFWEQRKSIYEFGEYTIRPGDVVLDCGANIGTFARFALKRGAEKVVCIDPSPEAIECLRRNFEEEIATGRVVVYPKGVWNEEDWLELAVSDLYSVANSVVLSGSRLHLGGKKVPLTKIDKLVSELNLQRVDFIKMDIEGAERQALQGAVETVARYQPRLAIALEHRREDLTELPVLIARQWRTGKSVCGPCSWVRSEQVQRIQPEVIFAGF